MVSYIVVDENKLCYVNSAHPFEAGVLASSTIRGASHHPANGPIALPQRNSRPATLEDFDTFRVSPVGHIS